MGRKGGARPCLSGCHRPERDRRRTSWRKEKKMSEKLNYNVQIRERIGKGGAREARRNGKVPGVLYGGGEDPVAVNLKLNEVIKGINSGHFLTSTANLVHDGKKQLVIPR